MASYRYLVDEALYTFIPLNKMFFIIFYENELPVCQGNGGQVAEREQNETFSTKVKLVELIKHPVGRHLKRHRIQTTLHVGSVHV